jgi:hypothetical protein
VHIYSALVSQWRLRSADAGDRDMNPHDHVISLSIKTQRPPQAQRFFHRVPLRVLIGRQYGAAESACNHIQKLTAKKNEPVARYEQVLNRKMSEGAKALSKPVAIGLRSALREGQGT